MLLAIRQIERDKAQRAKESKILVVIECFLF
jgi:hypothetical protein